MFKKLGFNFFVFLSPKVRFANAKLKLNINLTFPNNVVVSISRLTAFYVVLVPLELIPSKPPHNTLSVNHVR